MTKHKHAEVIKAWADGAHVETSEDGLVWSHVQHPRWYEDMQYRIEQSPVIEVKYYFKEGAAYYEFHPKIPDIWNLKITYQDGKAIKAELPE